MSTSLSLMIRVELNDLETMNDLIYKITLLVQNDQFDVIFKKNEVLQLIIWRISMLDGSAQSKIFFS